MSEQDRRILQTVRILKSWAGTDHATRRILHELCSLGYLEIIPKRPERPPSYRLTVRGRAATDLRTRTGGSETSLPKSRPAEYSAGRSTFRHAPDYNHPSMKP